MASGYKSKVVRVKSTIFFLTLRNVMHMHCTVSHLKYILLNPMAYEFTKKRFPSQRETRAHCRADDDGIDGSVLLSQLRQQILLIH